MSIFLRGLNMPHEVPLSVTIHPDGFVTWGFFSQAENVAVQIPEKHGRLGDLDAIAAKLQEEAARHTIIGDLNRMTLGVGEVIERIKEAPTIIPAEGGEDDA